MERTNGRCYLFSTPYLWVFLQFSWVSAYTGTLHWLLWSALMEVMFVLLLYMNDNLKEWMGHYENDSGEWVEMGMSGCLSMKRTLKRNGWKDTASGKTRFTCEKRTVELKTNNEGNIVVAKVLWIIYMMFRWLGGDTLNLLGGYHGNYFFYHWLPWYMDCYPLRFRLLHLTE